MTISLKDGLATFKVPTGVNFAQVEPECKLCDDRGAVRVYLPDGDYRDEPCKCRVERETETYRRYAIRRAGLEIHEADWTLDYLDKHGKWDITDKARAFMGTGQPMGMIMFYGPFGTGKTGILKCIAGEMLRRELDVRYILASDYLQAIRDTYDDPNSHERDVIKEYLDCRVLLVDEVDPDRMTDTKWAAEKMFTLLDKRYRSRYETGTVIASNRRPQDLWPYLASRMQDAERVMVAGEVLRGL